MASYHVSLLAGSLKLRTSVLTDEVRGIQRAFGRRLENEEDLSLGLTAYCPPEHSSLLACTVFFKDRTADLLDVVHVSVEGHTAEYMAGIARDRLKAYTVEPSTP
jgi:hypothetical protein